MNMLNPLESVKYLIRYYYIYKYKSYVKACENYYEQIKPGVMKYSVSNLEDIYGTQLITDATNKLAFTEAGDKLGHLTQRIFDSVLMINNAISRVKMEQIRFGCSPDFYKYFIKPVFYTFRKKYPRAQMIIVKANEEYNIEQLIHGRIDFVMGTMPANLHPVLDYQKIMNAKILLAVREDKYQLFKHIESLEMLSGYHGAMNDFTDPLHTNIKVGLEKANLNLNLFYMTSDFQSLIDEVRNGFVDYAFVGNYDIVEGLEFIDVSRFFSPVVVCFILRKGDILPDGIKELINISEKIDIMEISG